PPPVASMTQCHALLLLLLPLGAFPTAGLATGLRRASHGSPRAADTVPEVVLPSGARILGKRLTAVGHPKEDDVYAYFNLRYAEAARFDAPTLYEAPANAVLNGTEVNLPCLQRSGDDIQGVEDCLTLAVYIPPAPIEAGKRPVVVQIHGGFLMNGGIAGDMQKLNHLVRRADCVLVSIQYRLHLFGFFQPPVTGSFSANRGLRDQLAALTWVQRNIASFGGDPNAVTIFGQSAGGRSVVSLEQSPLSAGLFQQAIALSPGFLPAMFTADISEVEQTSGQRCLNATGCTSLQCLRDLDARQLLEMCRFYQNPQEFIDVPGFYFSGYDGEVLTAPIQSMYCSGADKPHGDRPMILGSVTREWNIFSLSMSPADATGAFLQEFSDGATEQGNSSYLQCARSSLLAATDPEPCPAGVLGCALTSPALMQAATDIYSAGTALSLGPGGGPRYRYLLDTEAAGSTCSSCHGADMDLMYGLRSPFYVGPSYPQGKLDEMTSILMQYLVSFILTGKPTSAAGPAWAPVDRSGEKDTYGTPLMVFNLSAPSMAVQQPIGPSRVAAQE
ncbi:Ces4a, partial [Symbiodinium microadriaticum]